jgi:hypothetical protein
MRGECRNQEIAVNPGNRRPMWQRVAEFHPIGTTD